MMPIHDTGFHPILVNRTAKVRVAEEDIELIARRVVELLKETKKPVETDLAQCQDLTKG